MTPRKAFTLIELLVVISIISLLISILLPALASARESARAIKCNANMHALGQATQIYTSDFQEYLPHLKDPTSTPSYTVWTRSGTWFALLGGHVFNWKVKQLSVGPAEVELQGPNVIHCPSNFNDKNWNVNHYASSLRNENLRTTDILKPSARIFLLDSKSSELPVNDTNYFNYTAGYQDKWVMRHQGGANFLFLDGHAVRQPEAAFRETGNIVFKWSE